MSIANDKAELPLGFRGAVTLRLHPVITLTPAVARATLQAELKPTLELGGACTNLEGAVPCSLTWLILRKDGGPAEPRTYIDPRKVTLEGSDGRYRVLADGKAAMEIDVLKLNLLGKGELGYRIQPETPGPPCELTPSASKITFDYGFGFRDRKGLAVGKRLRIDPTFSEALRGSPVRLTLFDSDDAKAVKSYVFEWKLGEAQPGGGEALYWRFGCSGSAQDEADAPMLDYFDHLEGDGVLEYGARIEILDRLSAPGAKARVKAAVEYGKVWACGVPALREFVLETERSVAAAVGLDEPHRVLVRAKFTGFDADVAVGCEVALWAESDLGEVRRVDDVLLDARQGPVVASGAPWLLLPTTRLAATAVHASGAHRFEATVFDIDVARSALDDVPTAATRLAGWSLFAELRVSPAMTGNSQRPMSWVVSSGLDPVDRGAHAPRASAAGVRSRGLSLAALLE